MSDARLGARNAHFWGSKMLGRQSGVILILSALVAFLLPLGGRAVWQQFQQFTSAAWRQSSPTSELRSRSETSDFAASANPPARIDTGPVAQATYTVERPGLFPGYQPRRGDRELAGNPPPVAKANSPPWSEGRSTAADQDPLQRFKSTLIKLACASAVLVLVCLVCVRVGQPLTRPRSTARQLLVEDSIALSREAGVKLICAGEQKFVVGYDRRGVQSMVMLPQRFEEVFRGELRANAADANDAAQMADSIRTTLTNPEDDGWELNRRIS